MRSAALLVPLAMALVCTSCRQDTGGTASAAPPATPQLEVTTVKSAKLNTTERLPAELTPYERVEVFAKETGFVKSMAVDRGSKVKQGELMAELEAPELVARQAQANAAYESAQSQLAAGQARLASDQGTYQHMSAAAKVPGVVAANDLEIAQKTVQADEANCRSPRENSPSCPGESSGGFAASILLANHGPVRWPGDDSLRPPRRVSRSGGRPRRLDPDCADSNAHAAPVGDPRAGV